MDKVSVNIEESKSGFPILSFELNGKKKYVHSKYDPIKEAQEWCVNISKEKSSNKDFIVFGGGMLYQAKELVAKNPNGNIFVIEPSTQVSDFLKNGNVIYTELTSNSRFSYFAYDDIDTFENVFSRLVNTLNLSSLKFITFSPYEEYFEDIYKIVVKVINDHIFKESMNIITQERFVYDHMDNIFNNAYQARDASFCEKFKDKFKGKKAVIVSAGPSLEKNIHKLKGNEGKYIIITGGRTLSPLLNNGIKPHFVASLDPSYANFQLIENHLDSDIPIVLTMLVNKNISERYKGEKIFLNNSAIENFDTYFFERTVGSLSIAGTVATLQIAFAIHLGCDEIAFIGQDLAFTGGKNHADIAKTESEKANNNNVISDDILKKLKKVKGSIEEYVYTNISMYSFANHIEEIIKIYKDVKYYDCTEGGMYIEGSKVISLDEFTKMQSEENNNFYDEIDKIIKENKNEYTKKFMMDKFKNLKKISHEVMKLAEEGKDICSLQIERQQETEKENKKLKKIDNKISKRAEKIDLTSVIANELANDFKNIRIDKTKDEMQQLQDARKLTRSYYLLTQGVYGTIIKYLEKAMDEIEENEQKCNDRNNE